MSRPTCLVIGGASDIGRSVAHVFAAQGYDIQLAARSSDRLIDDAADIQLRHGIDVHRFDLDVQAMPQLHAWVKALPVLPDVAVCVVGRLGNQTDCETDPQLAAEVIEANFTGPAGILSELAYAFEERGRGALVGVSSVAGCRGRATNYVYGSAKAGFTAYLSGLRNRLVGSGVHVLTVLPGFVDTAMTSDMKLPKALTASPRQVAEAIYRASIKRRDVIYVLGRWRWVMLIIKAIPEALFKKLSL